MRGVVVALALLAGCGGDDGGPSLSAEETARAWVDAVNARDYGRACELSAFEGETDCVGVLKERPFGTELEFKIFHGDRVEGPDAGGTASIAFVRPDGAGIALLHVEPHGHRYKVDLEPEPPRGASPIGAESP